MVERRAASTSSGQASRGLLDSGHAVLRMRVNIGTQLVRRFSPIGRHGDRDHILRRRRFTLEGVQPLPHMPLLHVAIWVNTANRAGQRDLPAHQLNRSR